jgi:hypothetical protein
VGVVFVFRLDISSDLRFAGRVPTSLPVPETVPLPSALAGCFLSPAANAPLDVATINSPPQSNDPIKRFMMSLPKDHRREIPAIAA